MDLELTIAGEIHSVSAAMRDDVLIVRHKGTELEVELSPISEGLFRLRVGDNIHRIHLVESEGKIYCAVLGHRFCVSRQESRRSRSADLSLKGGEGAVCPPMPGMVVKVNVEEGDLVERNQSLAIVEAMKMENELKSPLTGKVKKIHASPGDLVEAGTPLIELEAI
jgi:biotin carboxyl carrier protein